MRTSRFTEEQKIAIVRELCAGVPAKELSRRHGVSVPTLSTWRSRYEGASVAMTRRVRFLEDENAALKRLLAETYLEASRLRGLLGRDV